MQQQEATWKDVIEGRASWSAEVGDALEWLPTLPDDSVSLTFCSPPYENCRLYREAGQDLKIARKPDDWVRWMVDVCHELRRVTTGLVAIVCEGRTQDFRWTATPFLLMAELHRAGFNLRKPCVYERSGISGGGGPDWWRNDWEPVICFTRPGKLPWSDNTATGGPPVCPAGGEMSYRDVDGERADDKSRRRKAKKKSGHNGYSNGDLAPARDYVPPEVCNPGNVIHCVVGGGRMGSPLSHENEAPFPSALVEPFVRCFAPPGSVVLDCFGGSGTTAAVAVEWRRRAITLDLRESQVALIRKRMATVTPTMFLDDSPVTRQQSEEEPSLFP